MIDSNIDLSVVKRRTDDIDEVVERLQDQGFSIVSERGMGVTLESPEGLSFCVYEGPFAVWVTPSGPIRGRLFSQDAVGFGIDRDVVETNNNRSNNQGNPSDRGSMSDNRYVV